MFICVETNLENAIHFTLVVRIVLLVSYHEVEDLLDHAQTWVEDDIAELWTAENTLLHVFKRNVLEAEDLLCIVVSDGGALHSADFHLHYVLQKATPNKIIVLALKWAVIAFESNDFIV